jgi:hypothetical protein
VRPLHKIVYDATIPIAIERYLFMMYKNLRFTALRKGRMTQVMLRTAQPYFHWLLKHSNDTLEATFQRTTLHDLCFTERYGNTFSTSTPAVMQRLLDKFLFRLALDVPMRPLERNAWHSREACYSSGHAFGLPLRLRHIEQVGGVEGLSLLHTPGAFDSTSRKPVAVIMPGAGMRMEGNRSDARGREFTGQLHAIGFQEVIMVNLPGFSDGAGNANQWTLNQVAEALNELLRETGNIHRSVLIGYSTSNYVLSMMVALNTEDRALGYTREGYRVGFMFAPFSSLPQVVRHHVFQAGKPHFTPAHQWMIGRFLPMLQQTNPMNNVTLLYHMPPEMALHIAVSPEDDITPLYMSQRLHHVAQERGMPNVTLSRLPEPVAGMDAHASAVLRGVFHEQYTLARCVHEFMPYLDFEFREIALRSLLR